MNTTESTAPRTIDRLILVYAANSGPMAAFLDSAKKLLQVKGCSLCALTHGLAGERDEWRSCREEIGVSVDYYHLDDVPPPVAKAAAGKLPSVIAQVGSELIVLLDPDAIDRLNGSVNDFRARLDIRAAMVGLELPAAAPVAA